MTEVQSENDLTVSVVIASKVGAPFIDRCLESLERQAHDLRAEVIVVAAGPESYAQRIADAFGWVRVVHAPEVTLVPALRARGVETATGDLVAIIEEHCIAAADWLVEAKAAHARGAHAAVGGPVSDHDYRRARDWVVYFCEYNGSFPPAPEGEVYQLNGANIAYRRAVLLENRGLLDEGYWEAALHPVLLERGMTFLSAPRMIVHHTGPFDFGYYLSQRYLFSRAYAGARAATQSAVHRTAYMLGAPLVPLVLLGRMAARVWAKRCRVGRFVLTLPLIVPALIVFVTGEWVGYLLGPGDALSKVE